MLGILLVLFAVVAGARVFASADHYSQVYVAKHALVPGERRHVGDLAVGRVRLDGQGSLYVAAGSAPVGYVVTRYVGAHEFLPVAALAAAPPRDADSRFVTVPVAAGPSARPTSSHGSLVDVYLTPKAARGRAAFRRRRWCWPTSRCSRGKAGRGPSAVRARSAVVLAVPADRVADMVHAVESGTIDLVAVPAGRRRDGAGRRMTVPVLTAVTDPRWEADIVASLAARRRRPRRTPVRRPRRPARGGRGRARARGAAVRRPAPARPRRADPARGGRRRRRRAWSSPATSRPSAGCASSACSTCCRLTHPPRRSSAALVAAVGRRRRSSATTTPTRAPCCRRRPTGRRSSSRRRPAAGRVIAVWGPTGAPGRTTSRSASPPSSPRSVTPTLLVDADVYGGVGRAAARAARRGAGHRRRVPAGQQRHARPARRSPSSRSRCVPACGCSPASRAPSAGRSCVRARWRRCSVSRAASLPYVVIDCGFGLERDEELSYDTVAPRRNGATLAALDAADTVVAVASGDPVGLQRLRPRAGRARATRCRAAPR